MNEGIFWGKYLACYRKPYEEAWWQPADTLTYYEEINDYINPLRISHYCTVSTLQNILSEKRLRFSDVRFLNDTTEFIDALLFYKQAVSWRKDKMAPALYQRLSSDDLIAQLENYAQYYSLVEEGQPLLSKKMLCRLYTCSFSVNEDSLPLWVYYGDTSSGCNLLFEAGNLFPTEELPIQFFSGRVLYDESQKRKCIEAFLSDVEDLWQEADGCFDWLGEELVNIVVNALNRLRIFFKHKSFINEEEYRFALALPVEWLNPNESQLSLRTEGSEPLLYPRGFFSRGNLLVPYVDIPFSIKNLSAIVLGPYAKSDISQLSIREYLLWKSLPNIPVYISGIPLLSTR